ncbi:MAG: hypothetical protein JSS66_03530 [Armatimonadetes bacterium]|nr:hypothetical protein [Armatimonadota bacterium]
MRLLLCKLCEYGTQQQNGRHSMVGIFDNIVAPSFPIDHPAFFICLQFEFEAAESGDPMDVLVKLVDDDARALLDFTASGEVPRDVSGGPTRLFMQFQIPGLRLEKPGDYQLEVVYNGRHIGEERLPVILAQVPGN